MRPNDVRNRPGGPAAYAGQPQPHMRHPREQEMSSPRPNYQQYGPPSHGPQYHGPQSGFYGPQDPSQMNLQPMNMRSSSALTFSGSSQSMSHGSQGPARKPTIRHIPLTPEGNLVVDVPVPDRVLSNAKYQSGDEFTYTRYTAVTSSPDQFPYSGYSLRQQEMQRNTELFIVVTM